MLRRLPGLLARAGRGLSRKNLSLNFSSRNFVRSSKMPPTLAPVGAVSSVMALAFVTRKSMRSYIPGRLFQRRSLLACPGLLVVTLRFGEAFLRRPVGSREPGRVSAPSLAAWSPRVRWGAADEHRTFNLYPILKLHIYGLQAAPTHRRRRSPARQLFGAAKHRTSDKSSVYRSLAWSGIHLPKTSTVPRKRSS